MVSPVSSASRPRASRCSAALYSEAVEKIGRQAVVLRHLEAALQILVDGVPMPPRFPLELLPTPKEIAGIEVYDGPATGPHVVDVRAG